MKSLAIIPLECLVTETDDVRLALWHLRVKIILESRGGISVVAIWDWVYFYVSRCLESQISCCLSKNSSR